MHRFITRQPILDRHEKVFGYELLPRPGDDEFWPAVTSGPTEAEPFPGAPTSGGWEELTDGARAFIKCTPEALIGGLAAQLPRDQVVLSVQARRESNETVVKACQALKDAGFMIALENFDGTWEDPLAEIAKIIKMDIIASTDRAQWLFIRKYQPLGTAFVAHKVETRTQFQTAIQQGYAYFQGQFFLRPAATPAAEVTPTKLVYLLVLAAVTRPEIDVQEVANTIKHDLALSYKLLRFLNSARFAFHTQIRSIRHALLLLGQNEIRKWIGLISVTSLGEGGPPILVSLALVRAAFCESLAPLVGAAKRQSDYFFLGLLSSLDVLMRRPMRVILADLPIAPDVGAALGGEQNTMRNVLQTVLSYEQGHWEEFSQLARKLEVREEKLSELYLQALRWSRELTRAGKDEPVAAKSA